MTVLIIGGSGFLGGELTRQAIAAGHTVTATFGTRAGALPGAEWRRLDLRRPEAITSLFEEVRPTVVINTAYRRSDWATTADGAIRVAMAALDQGARLVQVSSDTVFSGDRVHYDEDSLPDPVTPYGAAKAAAETAIRLLDPTAVIARTSLIIGDGGSVHESLVHDLATGRRDGALFTDDVRCPVHVGDLAAALLELAFSDYGGVCHVAGSDAVSRYELGTLIARRDGLDPCALTAGKRAEMGPPGPLDVRLESGRTQSRVSTVLRGAREFLAAPVSKKDEPGR